MGLSFEIRDDQNDSIFSGLGKMLISILLPKLQQF
jgi:hypothetical protein